MVFMTSGAQNLKEGRKEKKNVGDHQVVCHLASGRYICGTRVLLSILQSNQIIAFFSS